MSHPRPRIACLAVAASLTGTSCATLVHGRQQDVMVTSVPPGAALTLNGHDAGVTPRTVRMRRRGPMVVEVVKDGFEPSRVEVGSRTSRWVAGNLIWLNPLAAQGMSSMGAWAAAAATWFAASVGVDVVSGGARARPPVVSVTLTPRATPRLLGRASGSR